MCFSTWINPYSESRLPSTQNRAESSNWMEKGSWDREWHDRVPRELGCHQPIPGHGSRDEGIHSLGGVPSFSGWQNQRQNCAKEVPLQLQQGAGQLESGREVGQQSRNWERRNEEMLRREVCRWTRDAGISASDSFVSASEGQEKNL